MGVILIEAKDGEDDAESSESQDDGQSMDAEIGTEDRRGEPEIKTYISNEPHDDVKRHSVGDKIMNFEMN